MGMKIGVDIMGGDFAPQAIVEGAILAHKQLPNNVKLVLIGNEEQARKIIAEQGADASAFDFVHTTEVIEMGDHPAKAFQKKTNSSITVGFGLLAKKAIDGFASAGNTGAMLVGTMFTQKTVEGVIRPGIASCIPQLNGGTSLIMDVGLNVDCKPEMLYQFAILGSLYAEFVLNIKNPKVGLVNIGEEKEKGNLLSKTTNELMQGTKDFNFIGNVEGNDIFCNKADVMVCDGFVGNIVLKQAESLYHLAHKRNITNDDFFERCNYEIYGGTPILGVNSIAVIGHGVSSPFAIVNMILQTQHVIEANLPEKFNAAFKQ